MEEATVREMADPATKERVIQALDPECTSCHDAPYIHQRSATCTDEDASHEELDGISHDS